MRRPSLLALAGLPCLLFAGLAAHADSLGNTVSATTNYPDSATVFNDLGTAVVGPGVEYTDGGGAFNIDVGGSGITTTLTTTGTFLTVPFEGYEIKDLTDAFASATFVSSTVAGFTAADLSFSGGTIFENYEGLTVSAGETVVIETTNAAVASTPEPSSMILFATSLLGSAGIIRKRHTLR